MAVVDAVCAKCGTALAFESLTSAEQVSDVLTQLSGDSHASVWPGDRTGFKSAPDSALAESFVDLGTTSSILSRGATKDAPATPGNDREAPQQRGRGEVLQQLFQMATKATHVEHPMCTDCVSDLVKEVEGEIQELKGEIEAYETAIQRLDDEEGSKQSSFTAAPGAEEEEAGAEDEDIERRASTSQAEDEELGELDEELLRLEEEEQREWDKLQQLQNALGSARDELLRLEELGSEIDDLELHYWTLHNQLHLEVQAHLESRDALLSRIEVADRQLERLQQVNVLDDIFHISNDGPFGTISGYRMGRVCTAKESASAVPWSEMNAAWGQCVLLLHTMAQFACCTLVPMGSQSRIKYKDHAYNLYGPPPLMQKSSYDTAMVVFLGAINEFAQWARAQDEAFNRNILLRLPYAIDPDRGTIMNRPIRRYSSMQASDKVWTKALKDMLVNLKWLQKWMVERTAMQANRSSAASSSQPSAQAVSAS